MSFPILHVYDNNYCGSNFNPVIYGVAFGLQEYSAQDPRGLEQTEADNGGVLLTFLLEKASEGRH